MTAVLAVAAAAAPTALAATAGATHHPDLRTILPTSSFSIAQTPTGREFRYTHLVYAAVEVVPAAG